jgi:uncharacterized membrane protein YdbT with pleckstrin-like domain
MGDRFREWLLRFLRVPAQPQAPAGDTGSVLTFRASPRYFQYRVALWALRQLGALAALIGGTIFLRTAMALADSGFFNIWGALELFAWLVFIVQLPFSFMLVRLDFEMRWYLLTDRSLRIREGILRVREKTLTYANIQNISIRKNPLQRLFGLATVAVRAAGGGSGSAEHGGSATSHTHEATFEGVDNSDQIREILRHRIRQHRDSGLGDPDDVADAAGAAPALLAARSLLEEARALRSVLTR